MLDTDKVAFKEWTVKLRNKYCQVRTGLDVGKSWDELEDLALWASALTEGPLDEDLSERYKEKDSNQRLEGEFSEELYSVILDKTEGETHRRVTGCYRRLKEQANGNKASAGLKTYLYICWWFMKTTGLNTSHRLSALMTPTAARTDEDVADKVEAWEREEAELIKLNADAHMGEVFRMTALKNMCTQKIKEHLELKSGGLGTNDQVRKEIMSYAVQRRVYRNTQQ